MVIGFQSSGDYGNDSLRKIYSSKSFVKATLIQMRERVYLKVPVVLSAKNTGYR